VNERNLHASAVDRIAEWIVTERHPAGSALPVEAELCAALGVSRTVVREAIKTLAAKGMVEVGRKLGTRVCDERAWQLFDPQVLGWRLGFRDAPNVAEDLVELRLLLEPAAAGLAAQRAGHSDRRELRRTYEAMIAAGGELSTYGEADVQFHRLIFRASHNVFLTRLAPLVEILISKTLRLYADTGWNADHIRRAALPLHGKLAEAIIDADAAGAEAAAKAIISRAYEDMAPAARGKVMTTASRARSASAASPPIADASAGGAGAAVAARPKRGAGT